MKPKNIRYDPHCRDKEWLIPGKELRPTKIGLQVALLMDIREELKRLNATVGRLVTTSSGEKK